MTPTSHTVHLRGLAHELVDAFIGRGATAALLVGSAATGTADEFSDLDLILFYDAVPEAAEVGAVMGGFGATEHRSLGGDAAAGFAVEQWTVRGIACQLVHQTVSAWLANAAAVLEDLDVTSPVQKAISGLHRGIPIHGDALIEELRIRATYTDALAVAMVEANLDIFPLWRFFEALSRRDAEWWQRSELVAGLGKVLALLAAANRVFYSPFQLKHMRELIAEMRDAPPDLADRIDRALVAPAPAAAVILENLVAETLDVVDRRVRGVDLGVDRGRLGGRQTGWSLPAPG